MKKLFLFIAILSPLLFVPTMAFAAEKALTEAAKKGVSTTTADGCIGATGSKSVVCEGIGMTGDTAGGPDIDSVLKGVIDLISILVGVASVIMIMLGGFKYVTSQGDSGNVKSAKDTILYAIIGLAVVALAQIIVKFVLSRL